jgi:hypothetical protein
MVALAAVSDTHVAYELCRFERALFDESPILKGDIC